MCDTRLTDLIIRRNCDNPGRSHCLDPDPRYLSAPRFQELLALPETIALRLCKTSKILEPCHEAPALRSQPIGVQEEEFCRAVFDAARFALQQTI